MDSNDLRNIQNEIGYTFKNSDLLQQAFVRRSYSKENGGEDNEVLEFIGDKVLDFIVVKLLAERFGFMISECDDFNKNEDWDEFACEKSEAQLTEIKKRLVQKKTLAERIDALGFADYLIMGKGDIRQNADKEDSVKEDLFEAILGAIAIDSNWNIEKLQIVVEIMLNPECFLTKNNEENYISLIQEWSLNQTGTYPQYHFEAGGYFFSPPFDGISQRFCTYNHPLVNQSKFLGYLKISDNHPIFRGFGRSITEARKNVCQLAYEYLRKNGLILTIRDEIENPNKNDAINQLEILARRGYFSIPQYKFTEKHDNDGNPIWICNCHITEQPKQFSARSSSKKEAKKSAAYKMLRFVLEI